MKNSKIRPQRVTSGLRIIVLNAIFEKKQLFCRYYFIKLLNFFLINIKWQKILYISLMFRELV